MNREEAARLDEKDPLASFRARFAISSDAIYMDGNSLGRLPLDTLNRLDQVIREQWGDGLVRSWHHWIDLAQTIGDKIATLVGANPGEVIVSDSTSVNLYKLAVAACDARPDRTVIVTDSGNFPSDLYVLQGVASSRDMQVRVIDDPSDIGLALDHTVAFASFSHVNFKTGALCDMQAITAEVHGAGALVLWDLCHSVGVLPIDLAGCDVDLAVGCTYKYLNSGPGAPAFIYVSKDLQASLRQPIWGWFGQKDQFAMSPTYDPAPGMGRFIVGTPPILSLAAIEVGVDLTIAAGIDRLRAKSIATTSFLIDMADELLTPHGVEVASPRDPERRGSHVALRHAEAHRLSQALVSMKNVIPDFREPDVVRYGIAPIYTSYVEIFDAVEALADLLATGSFMDMPNERPRVT